MPPELLEPTPKGAIPRYEVMEVALHALVQAAADRNDPVWGARIFGRLIARWMPAWTMDRYDVSSGALEALGEQAKRWREDLAAQLQRDVSDEEPR